MLLHCIPENYFAGQLQWIRRTLSTPVYMRKKGGKGCCAPRFTSLVTRTRADNSKQQKNNCLMLIILLNMWEICSIISRSHRHLSIREGVTKKSRCSSGFCPIYLPPPLPPNLDKLYNFCDRKKIQAALNMAHYPKFFLSKGKKLALWVMYTT